MPLWQWILDSFGVLAVLFLLVVVGLIARRRILARTGGTFELSLNTRPKTSDKRSARGWTLGIGRYSGDQLEWFRVFSFGVRPKRVFDRGRIDVVGRRDPDGPEEFALYAGHVVLECETDDGHVQLGLSPESVTGLLSWLESAPPGRDSNRVI